ncbi:MAG: hypothetical protein JNM85_01490 [Chthonomonas sp.]|nr:hypothetical protein [Chthonomonas sp.]
MKLNLLPKYVTQGARGRTFLVLGLLLAIGGAALAGFMSVYSSGKREAAKVEMDEAKVQADAVVALAQSAEAKAAQGTEVKRNLDLYKAMTAQNTKYTEFYRSIQPYIPSYMRVNAMSVRPASETGCLLTVTGVLQTYQQYADTALALLRIPGAVQVSRSTFDLNDTYVPGLDATDNIGLPHLVKAGRIPPFMRPDGSKGPDERIAYLVEQAKDANDGFTGAGNFGTGTRDAKRAMPKWSEVTFGVVLNMDPSIPADKQLNYDFRTPVPRASLAPVGPGSAAPPAAAGPGLLPAGGAPPAGVPGGGPGRPSQGGSPEDR